jgi:hypothetical protein
VEKFNEMTRFSVTITGVSTELLKGSSEYKAQQDTHGTYGVILRRVHVTIFAVEKQ